MEQEMHFDLQPVLKNDFYSFIPLAESDFDALYAVASNPVIWAQHPNKDRYKIEVFKTFFEGAMQSGGAGKIIENATGTIVGSSRFYEYDSSASTIHIGYTFFAPAYWGRGVNHGIKKLMLDHAFKFVDEVLLHVGSANFPSQNSITRLGAVKTGEVVVAYHGEEPKLNFIYSIKKQNWLKK